ncbi:MAG TPA: SDR family oxidoreductase [Acidimicrobiales bacterium]|nr:SDR family oxidoreductase [Acidimicrobiales bacterium]
MDLGIAGRSALIAASSAGLGYATAKALAEAGCKTVISGRDEERLHRAAEQIPDSIPVIADVSSVEGATQLVRHANDALGSNIDILVTNAGGPPTGTFQTTEVNQYLSALELNLMSVVAMCKEAVPEMQSYKWGRVLAITSISVRQPIPNIMLSNTARAGVTGFLKTMALEIASDGVTVNSIQPGFHATDRVREIYGEKNLKGLADAVPAKKIGSAEDFGKIAAFLCSEQAGYITGAAIPVAGGTYGGLQ